MTYAIFETGGKQYRVSPGDIVDVELLDAEEKGDEEFKDVLLAHDGKKAAIGTPTVEKAIVRAEVLDTVRGPKVVSYRYKKRKNYRRKVGHRQDYLRVKIKEIAA